MNLYCFQQTTASDGVHIRVDLISPGPLAQIALSHPTWPVPTIPSFAYGIHHSEGYPIQEQDYGKRVWLHEVLDRRFPSRDKLQHVAKWKSCTTAINRNRLDSQLFQGFRCSELSLNVWFFAEFSTTEVKPSVSSISWSKMTATEKKEPCREKDKESLKRKDDEAATAAAAAANAKRQQVRKDKEAAEAKLKEGRPDETKKERESSRISARAKGNRRE